jgi:hypothetical protein
MSGKVWFRIAAIFLFVVGVAALGAYAYNMGLAQGAMMAVAAPAAGGASPIVYPPYFYGGWHPGFGLFGWVIPLFLLFLFFGMIGRMFHFGMRRRWGYGGPAQSGHGPNHWQGDVPPQVVEMHRWLHEQESKAQPSE